MDGTVPAAPELPEAEPVAAPSPALGAENVASAGAESAPPALAESAPPALAESAPPAPASAAEPPAGPADELARQVRYFVTSEGLRVEVAGVILRPRATAMRVGEGWGVRVEVAAESSVAASAEAPPVLYRPDRGPLAFYARIDRGEARLEQQPDRREGGVEQRLSPGEVLTFTREWPGGSGAQPLTAGHSLELEVGLWGVGPTGKHRPLERFCTVRLTVAGAGKPVVVVAPPPTV